MLHSNNKKFFRPLVIKILWFTLNWRLEVLITQLPVSKLKLSSQWILNTTVLLAGSFLSSLSYRVMVKIVIDSCR